MGDGRTGRRVIVTGGASGIGKATVSRFVVGGDRVAVFFHRQVATAEESGAALAMRVDVADHEAVAKAIDGAASRLGGLDVLVCCAGLDLQGTIEKTAIEDWDHIFAVNVRGVFSCVQAAIPHLRSVGGGSIVIVSSQIGLVAQRNAVAYSAAKAAAIQLARSIVVDYGREGIRANSVCPGPTLTPMLEAQLASAVDREDEEAMLLGKELHGRYVTSEEVAEGIWYLASPLAASVLGEALVIDGGYVVH